MKKGDIVEIKQDDRKFTYGGRRFKVKRVRKNGYATLTFLGGKEKGTDICYYTADEVRVV